MGKGGEMEDTRNLEGNTDMPTQEEGAEEQTQQYPEELDLSDYVITDPLGREVTVRDMYNAYGESVRKMNQLFQEVSALQKENEDLKSRFSEPFYTTSPEEKEETELAKSLIDELNERRQTEEALMMELAQLRFEQTLEKMRADKQNFPYFEAVENDVLEVLANGRATNLQDAYKLYMGENTNKLRAQGAMQAQQEAQRKSKLISAFQTEGGSVSREPRKKSVTEMSEKEYLEGLARALEPEKNL